MILTLNQDKKIRKLSEKRQKCKKMDPEWTQQGTLIETIRNFSVLYGQPPFLMYAATYQRDSKYSTVQYGTVQHSTAQGRVCDCLQVPPNYDGSDTRSYQPHGQ